MGDLRGVDDITDQLRRYSQYFSDPKIHLQRVEEMVPGIVTASARLHVTVSGFTMRCNFPYLQKVSRSKYDTRSSAGERLLGQTLHCNCSMTFYFDNESGRVARLEIDVDWVKALLLALGNIVDVSKALCDALITPECLIGMPRHDAEKNTTY